jgi:hypothetical protein
MAKKSRPKRSTNNVAKAATEEPEKKFLPVKYVIPSEMNEQFANIFVVQQDSLEFHLLFFQVAPPLVVPGTPGALEAFHALEEANAHCVARIAMSAARIQGVIDALTKTLGMWKQHAEKQIVTGPKDAE